MKSLQMNWESIFSTAWQSKLPKRLNMWELTLEVLIKGLVVVAILMGFAAYMTLLERVVMAKMQLRIGPNRVGPLGLFQPIADGIKLLCKEGFQPQNIESFTYKLAPAISVFSALFAFVLIPFGDTMEL